MNVILISLVQLIGWILFVFTDYIEETTHNDFILITVYLVPVVAGVLYLVFDKRVHNEKWSRLVNRLCTIGIWVAETFIIATAIIWLNSNNMWIIQQRNEFFNGIEYMIFPLFFGIVPAIITAIWELIKFFIKTFKKSIDN